jgi:hypothetical protein
VTEPEPEPGDWEILRVTDSMLAEVLLAALRTAEIPATLAPQESVGRLYGLGVTELGMVRLMVPADRVAEARALLEDAEAIDFPASD